jgi:hypothetical protein
LGSINLKKKTGFKENCARKKRTKSFSCGVRISTLGKMRIVVVFDTQKKTARATQVGRRRRS